MAASRAYGGSLEHALDVAAAIELLHNSFLVLDDIQDDSRQRRGEPTMHVEHGVREAISAAGALLALAMDCVATAAMREPGLATRLFAEFAHLFRRTHEGQWTELSWRRASRNEVTETEYLVMVQDKTCWYTTIHPLRLGALLGSHGRADLDRLVEFGFYLGAVFQIIDDTSNLVADPGTYGKDVGADIAEGKQTLPIIDLLGSASPADRRRIVGLLGGGHHPASPGQRLSEVLALLRESGSMARTALFVDAIAALAITAAPQAFSEAHQGPDLDFLVGLVGYIRSSETSYAGRAGTVWSASTSVQGR